MALIKFSWFECGVCLRAAFFYDSRFHNLHVNTTAIHKVNKDLSNWVTLRGFSRGLDSNLQVILGPNATKS